MTIIKTAGLLSVLGVWLCIISAMLGDGPKSLLADSDSGAPIPHYAPTGGSVQPVDGISWEVAAPRKITVYDSVWVISAIRNVSTARSEGRPAVVLAALPDVEVLDPENHKRVITLTEGDLASYSKNVSPLPNEVCHQFRVDLRPLLGGKLSPGTYRVTLKCAGKDVLGPNGASLGLKEMVSTQLSIDVVNADLEKLADEHATQVMIQRDEPVNRRGGTVGHFVNKGKGPVAIPYYAAYSQPNDKPPLLEAAVELYRCGGGMLHRVQQSSVRYQTVQPNESVPILLPDWAIDGAGGYFYMLTLSVGEDGKGRAFARSQPFVVDAIRKAPSTASRPASAG